MTVRRRGTLVRYVPPVRPADRPRAPRGPGPTRSAEVQFADQFERRELCDRIGRRNGKLERRRRTRDHWTSSRPGRVGTAAVDMMLAPDGCDCAPAVSGRPSPLASRLVGRGCDGPDGVASAAPIAPAAADAAQSANPAHFSPGIPRLQTSPAWARDGMIALASTEGLPQPFGLVHGVARKSQASVQASAALPFFAAAARAGFAPA